MKNLKFFLSFLIFTNFMSFLIGASIKNIMVSQDPEVGYYKINFDLSGMKNKFYLIKIIPYKDKREIEQPKFMFGECVNAKCEADKNFCVFWDPVLEGVEPDNWNFKNYIDRTIYRLSGYLDCNMGIFFPLDSNLKEDYDTSGTFGGGCTLWDYSKFGIELDINLFSFIKKNTYKESNNEQEGHVNLFIKPDINLGLLYKLNNSFIYPYFGAGGCFYKISEEISYGDTEENWDQLSSGSSAGYYLKFGLCFYNLTLEATYSNVIKEYRGYYCNFNNFNGISVCIGIGAQLDLD